MPVTATAVGPAVLNGRVRTGTTAGNSVSGRSHGLASRRFGAGSEVGSLGVLTPRAFHCVMLPASSRTRQLTEIRASGLSMQRTRQVVECFHIARARGWLVGRRPWPGRQRGALVALRLMGRSDGSGRDQSRS